MALLHLNHVLLHSLKKLGLHGQELLNCWGQWWTPVIVVGGVVAVSGHLSGIGDKESERKMIEKGSM